MTPHYHQRCLFLISNTLSLENWTWCSISSLSVCVFGHSDTACSNGKILLHTQSNDVDMNPVTLLHYCLYFHQSLPSNTIPMQDHHIQPIGKARCWNVAGKLASKRHGFQSTVHQKPCRLLSIENNGK
jgi:hypothetical protein